MKRNIVVDPFMMHPHLKEVVPNCTYFSLHSEHINFIPNQIEKKYGSRLSVFGEKFDVCFFCISVLSTVKAHQGSEFIRWRKLYIELNNYIVQCCNRVVIIDNHGADYDPRKYLSDMGIESDLILKRIYCSHQNYDSSVVPYPVVMCTDNDPILTLYNSTPKPNTRQHSTILWCGNLHRGYEKFDDIFEQYDRHAAYNEIVTKYPNILTSLQIPYSNLVNTLNTFKYALDLRGCSRLNKRLFEILASGSLLMAQRIDVVWPFEKGDGFSDICFFDNVDQLRANYDMLEADSELYNKCINNQMYLVEKYFNKQWHMSYITDLVWPQKV